MGNPIEFPVELRMGAKARPTPHECATAVWGAGADYQASTEPTGAASRDWRTLYLLNNRTREVIDVAPLTDDVGSGLYKVSGRNLQAVQALAQFVAGHTDGTVS